MKKIKIAFWIFTILLSVMLGIGSVFDVLMTSEAVAHVTHIGYPAYIVPFVGVAKILGIVVIVIPRYPKLKEWAYAGITYDIVGAMYSHIAFGESASVWLGLLVPIILIAGSYISYSKLQKVATTDH